MLFASIPKKIYALARPYGRKRLAAVGAVTVLQGVMQTVGIASIFPFLALAADTSAVRRSQIGGAVLEALPEMTDRTLLIGAGIAAITMLFVANGLQLATTYITTRYTRGFGHWLRVRLLRQIAGQPYGYFLQNSTAVMLKKVNGDVQVYIASVLMPLFTAAAGLVNVALLAITLVYVDPIVALSAGFALGGIYYAIYAILYRHRREYSRMMYRADRETSRVIQMFLGGIKPIKVHSVEQTFVERFAKLSSEQARVQAAQNVYQIAPKNLIEPVALGLLVGIVIYYAARGDALVTVLPTLGLMAMAAYRLLPNIQNLYASASTFSSNLHTLEEVYDEFHGPGIIDPLPLVSPERLERVPFSEAIRLNNVSFRYPSGNADVIDRIDLAIPKNTSIALVGATGCGKSTLVDLILGLHAPTSGDIKVDTTVLDPRISRRWRRGIGYVPQDIFLLDDTVEANIGIGVESSHIDRDRLRKACAAAQILEFIEQQLPDGFQTQVGERGVRLSGGQRQRIGLARALYDQPDVLVLDEATSALDNATEAGVMQAIEQLEGEITMIIVAHRLSTIQWCDQVVELHAGSLRRSSHFV